MGEIMLVSLQGPPNVSPLDIRSAADWVIRPRLLGVSGVSQVSIIGGGVKQYQVLASDAKLRKYNITLHDLQVAAGASNQNTSGGFLISPNNQMMVRNLSRTKRLS